MDSQSWQVLPKFQRESKIGLNQKLCFRGHLDQGESFIIWEIEKQSLQYRNLEPDISLGWDGNLRYSVR